MVLHERSITQIANSIRRRDENVDVQVNASSGEDETEQDVELLIPGTFVKPNVEPYLKLKPRLDISIAGSRGNI